MKEFSSYELRKAYIDFFKSKGHKEIKSASLIPENDASVLFTTAGMQPLIPYLLGEKHPDGNRLVDSQKCVRTVDIDDVGDRSHLTFFEMLGNWSLGSYFKEESIGYSFEFLTKVLEIPTDKIAVTVFEGDEDAPRDTKSAERWEELGIPKENIFYLGKEDNWWWAGEEGPCGPDTEIFYIFDKEPCSNHCSPACNCGRYMEIWNNVFMEFEKKNGKIYPLKQKNVDTGMGLERILTVSQKKPTVYETDLFASLMMRIDELACKEGEMKSKRIIADHIRAAVMLIADGVRPSNVDQGYILRRLIRRTLRHMKKLEIDFTFLSELAQIAIDKQKEYFESVQGKETLILNILNEEMNKFSKTLVRGEKKFEEMVVKNHQLTKEDVFHLYDTFGFPLELTEEMAKERNITIDKDGFYELFKEHQEKSRMGSEAKFKGGLKATGEQETKYHTATHLLNEALRRVLGDHVHQKGSNITEERLRFDFSHPSKVTKEELQQVEDLVNEQIQKDLKVTSCVMKKEEALASGAEAMFVEKYGDLVTVYSIGDFSKEICGGPHVSSTKELGHFKIKKEEASSSGVRRIKAILE